MQSNGKWSTAQMLNLTRIKQRIYHVLIIRMMRSDCQNRSRYIPKSKLLKPVKPVKSPPEVVAHGQSGQVAEPRLQVAPGAIQPRLQVAPGEIQPSTEKADHLTPDEVVTDPMPSRTVVRCTDVRPGQEPSSRTTDLCTGQEPSSSRHTTDLHTSQRTNKGQRTNQERRVTRSHHLI